MIDCSLTKNYFKELDRMCNYFSTCIGCEISKAIDRETCDEFQLANRKWMITTIQNWSNEHPQKTYLEDMFEKYPNADFGARKYPWNCPSSFGYKDLDCDSINRCITRQTEAMCKECWNQLI